MKEGDEFTGALDKPGEYVYYCVLHGGPDGTGMAATVIVE
jgi:plastocyanin